MAFEDREMSGFIFRNKERKSEKHPTMRGTCLVNGQPHEIALWTKETEKAGKFFSFKISPARERPATQAERDADDGVPF